MNTKDNKLQEDLQQFCGSQQMFQLPLIKTRFTDGVHYLAQKASCFWLITDASLFAKNLINKSHFITIDFRRLSETEKIEKGYEAIMSYGDGNENILETHRYGVTDFPLDELRLYFVNVTLMLPNEY